MYFEVFEFVQVNIFFSRTHLHIDAPGGPMEVPLMAEVPLTVEGSSPSVVYIRGGV